MIQEHSVPEVSRPGMVKMAVARGLSLHMGPTDPDTLKPSAGVAVLARRMHRVTPVADLPESLLPYVHAGRLSVHLCDTGA
eukprot:3859310-Alexandrium_andersonii.AAC.1